jgi:hypothetical protein
MTRWSASSRRGQRDALIAQEEAVAALFEQARVRVTSVANGDDFFKKNPGATVPMPEGFKVFETTGAWESYSTPARDLRLLIAMDVVHRVLGEGAAAAGGVRGAGGGASGAGAVAKLEQARDALVARTGFASSTRAATGASGGCRWRI